MRGVLLGPGWKCKNWPEIQKRILVTQRFPVEASKVTSRLMKYLSDFQIWFVDLNSLMRRFNIWLRPQNHKIWSNSPPHREPLLKFWKLTNCNFNHNCWKLTETYGEKALKKWKHAQFSYVELESYVTYRWWFKADGGIYEKFLSPGCLLDYKASQKANTIHSFWQTQLWRHLMKLHKTWILDHTNKDSYSRSVVTHGTERFPQTFLLDV